jgi:uncharacterized membrane protein
MSFFWPTRKAAAATLPVRLGRLLHWFFLALGGVNLLIAGWALQSGVVRDWRLLAIWPVSCALFAIAGRGLRYLLSDE